jgi:autotransporter-associated beta strand protein
MQRKMNARAIRVAMISAVVATVSLSAASIAKAQTDGTFSNTAGGSWADSANWTGGAIAGGAGATANFTTIDIPASTTRTVDLNGTRTIGTLNLADSNVTTAGTWAFGTGTDTTSQLIFSNTSGPGVVNVGAIAGNAAAGLANGQTVTMNAPVVAPNGLSINVGNSGTSLSRIANLTFGASAHSLTGAVSITGAGTVNFGTNSPAALAGVTSLTITNPYTAGSSGASFPLNVIVNAGTHNLGTINIVTQNNGLPSAGDRRAYFQLANGAVVNANVVLTGEADGYLYGVTSGFTGVLNGNINMAGVTRQQNSGTLFRGVGNITVNGNITGRTATPQYLTRNDNGVATVNGNIDIYMLDLAGGNQASPGGFRLPAGMSSVSNNTRLALGGIALETNGTLTRSLGSGPGQIFTGSDTNTISAVGGDLTVNFGGAGATVLLDSPLASPLGGTTFTAAVNPAALDGKQMDVSPTTFDPVGAGVTVGMLVRGNNISGRSIVTTVTPGSELIALDQVVQSAGTPNNITFQRTDRLVGALQFNNANSTNNLTVVNKLDLNVASGEVARTINVGGRRAILAGGIVNSGAGIANLVKGGAGVLEFGPASSINGRIEVTGGSISKLSNVTGVTGVYVTGGAVELPTTATGAVNWTIGTALPGTTTPNVFFTKPDGTSGTASGLANASGSPVTLTLNGGATLNPATTTSYRTTGWRLGAGSNARMTVTNNFDISGVGGNFELWNDSTDAELVMSGNMLVTNTTNGGQIVKQGPGVVVLAGANQTTKQTAIAGGTLAITSPAALGTAALGSNFDVPVIGAGVNGTLRFDAPMTLNGKDIGASTAASVTLDTNGNDVTLGSADVGTVIGKGSLLVQTNTTRLIKAGAGTLTLNYTSKTSNVQNLTVSNGTLKVNAGSTVTTNGSAGADSRLLIGDGVGSAGTLEVNGGAVTSGSAINLARGAGTGTLLVQSGSVTASTELLMGFGSTAGSTANLTVNGGTVDAVYLRVASGTNTSTVRLNGGTLSVNAINENNFTPSATSSSTLYFNGGTFAVKSDRVADRARALEGLDNAYISNGGGRIQVDDIVTPTPTAITVTVNQKFDHDPAGAAIDGGLEKLGTGTLVLGGANTFNGGTKVSAGKVVAATSTSFGSGPLTLAASTSATVNASVGTLKVSGLSIGTGAALTLNDNALVVDYTGASPIAAVAAAVNSFRNGGTWNGTSGIIASPTVAAGQAIGVAESSGAGTFAGLSVDATSVLVRRTLAGDANLDLTVNFDDLLKLAAAYNQAGTWGNGDFNYDGQVNFDDLLQLAANYNQTLTGSFGGDWALAVSSVPEPGMLSLLAVAAPLMTRRRRCASTSR